MIKSVAISLCLISLNACVPNNSNNAAGLEYDYDHFQRINGTNIYKF